MVWTCDVLDQKRWWLAHIQQENVHVAVISYISKSGTPPARQRKRGEPGCSGYIFKCAIAFVPEQKHRLPISRAVIDNRIHLRINVAARHKYIRPAVVIKVHKARTPLDIGVNTLTHLRTPTQFDESLPRPLVAISVIHLFRKVSNCNVQAAVVITVTK